MKRCPACGTIMADGSTVCGLCGSNLWGIEEEQLDVAVSETEKSQDVSEKLLDSRESSIIRRRAIGKLVVGLVLVIVGPDFSSGEYLSSSNALGSGHAWFWYR